MMAKYQRGDYRSKQKNGTLTTIKQIFRAFTYWFRHRRAIMSRAYNRALRKLYKQA